MLPVQSEAGAIAKPSLFRLAMQMGRSKRRATDPAVASVIADGPQVVQVAVEVEFHDPGQAGIARGNPGESGTCLVKCIGVDDVVGLEANEE